MMNYSPTELKNLSFAKSLVRGYNEIEVDETLDKIVDDYSKLIHENIELKDKVSVLNDGMMHYKKIEESLQSTLLIAQQTAEDIKKNAYEKADNIIKEAELKARKIIDEANDQSVKAKFEFEDTRKKLQIYKTKIESLIMSQLEIIKQTVDFEEA